MSRIIQTEFDSRYFDIFGEVMMKSFITNNPGWEFHVLDFGLRPEQRKVIERFGTVERAEREAGNRWSTIRARMKCLAQLVQKDDIVVHIDGDTFISASIDGAINAVEDADCSAGYMMTWMKLGQHVRNLEKFKGLVPLKRLDVLLDSRTLAGVFFVLLPDGGVRDVFAYVDEVWDDLRAVLYTEESMMLCGHTLREVPFAVIPRSYGWSVGDFGPANKGYVIPADAPNKPSTVDPIHVVHFVNTPWRCTNTASRVRQGWQAWQHATRGYKDIPWAQLEEQFSLT